MTDKCIHCGKTPKQIEKENDDYLDGFEDGKKEMIKEFEKMLLDAEIKLRSQDFSDNVIPESVLGFIAGFFQEELKAKLGELKT